MCLLAFKVNPATGRCEEAPAIPEAGSAAIQGASPTPANGPPPAYSPMPYVPASTGPMLSPAIPAGDTSLIKEDWFAKYFKADPGGWVEGAGGQRGAAGGQRWVEGMGAGT